MTDTSGAYLQSLQSDPNGTPGATAGGVAVGRPMGGLKASTAGQTILAPPYLAHPSAAAQENTFAPGATS